MSETRIVGDCLAWLKRQPGWMAWRNNTGGAQVRGRYIQFGTPGAPDIMAIHRGRFYGIECKSEAGRQSPLQARWQRDCQEAGGVYVLVRSREELERALREHGYWIATL